MRPLNNRIIGQRRHILRRKRFRNRNHAVRQRNKPLNKRLAAVGNPCQRNLRRTAAYVKDQSPLDVAVQKRNTADHSQPGLFLGRNRFNRQAGFLFDQIKKFLAVFGPAAGCRRHETRAVNRRIFLNNAGTNLQRIDCPTHGRPRQFIVIDDTLAQPRNFGKSLDDAERSRGRTGNYQPAGIGSQVDGGKIFLRLRSAFVRN